MQMPPGLKEAMDSMFMPSMLDPAQESFKLSDIMEFASKYGHVTDPQSFMSWVSEVDKRTMQWMPNLPLVDRVWRATQQWTAERAMGKLRSGSL